MSLLIALFACEPVQNLHPDYLMSKHFFNETIKKICRVIIVLTLHSFDADNKTWGPQLVSAKLELQKNDAEKWIRFNLPTVPLFVNETYGFRLFANNALVGIGEATSGTQNAFTGEEWHGDSKDQNGHYYHYFSLAFKIEMCA
jgi:hypothetical protein